MSIVNRRGSVVFEITREADAMSETAVMSGSIRTLAP